MYEEAVTGTVVLSQLVLKELRPNALAKEE